MSAAYALAGLVIQVSCTDAEMAELVESRLDPLRTDAVGPAVTVDIRGPGADPSWPPAPAGAGRPIYDAPTTQIEYFDGSDQLFVDYEQRSRLLVTPGEGRIQISVTGSHPGDAVLAAHPLLTIALLETMKRFGRFPLPAAGLSRNGKGVLVPGASGAGKSTMSVALVRAGFDFLADDTVFITTTVDGLWVWGFPDEIDVTEDTTAMVPELGYLAGSPLLPGRDKHSFRVEEVFGVAALAGTSPAVLIAPQIVAGPDSELEPMAPSDALLELLPNVLLTHPVPTQAHLAMLATLVRTVPCLRMRVGSDLEAAAAGVAGLLT